MKINPSDTQFEETVVDSVDVSENSYSIGAGGYGLGCPKVAGLPVPQIGETMRLYGKGFGYPVRGIVIGGRVYRYRTELEHIADLVAEQAAEQVKREAALLNSIADTDKRIAALPKIFRERMAKFQRDGGHKFRRDYESYELFCCEQAVAIADALQTEAAIVEWAKEDFEAQKLRVEALSHDHSGNTFGAACLLARLYVTKPEFVPKMHGALTPLVGCEAYGCAHTGTPQ